MLSVSISGAGVDSGGGGNGKEDNVFGNNINVINNRSSSSRLVKIRRIRSSRKINDKLKVPKRKSVKRIFGRRHQNLWVCVVLPVLLGVLCSFPAECQAGKTKKDSGSKNGNFSQSPTNHEEVSTRNKENIAITGTAATDDYWVGSHKLEFKPHPLLMPSTSAPTTAQIPVPFFALGPTTTPSSPSSSSSESGGVGSEVDDLVESASNSASDEERKGKGKTRKSRGGRKKSRDQRRMAHRTLWARQNAASANITSSNPYMIRGLQQNPYFLHNHHQIQHQQSPIILTGGGSMMGAPQNPLLIPPLNSRTDDSFHGSATTWNINHPGNGIIAPNLIQSYSPSQQHQQSNGQGTSSSSSSQETSQQVQQQQQQFPSSPSSSIQQFPFGYSQFHHHPPQSVFASHLQAQSPQQQQRQQSQQIPLQMPPLAHQTQHVYSTGPSGGGGGVQYLPQQSGSTPVLVSGSNGPVLMYMGPGGLSTQGGIGQIPSASGPIPVPVKPFNINEIPGAGFPPHLQYNHITGPDLTGAHHHPHHHSSGTGGGGGGSSSGSNNNPHYLRNNFLRMVMDKMANVGRLLPIPFVTKYATPAQLAQSQQQAYSRQGNNAGRRMKK